MPMSSDTSTGWSVFIKGHLKRNFIKGYENQTTAPYPYLKKKRKRVPLLQALIECLMEKKQALPPNRMVIWNGSGMVVGQVL